MSHGAQVPASKNKEVLEVSIQNGEFRIVDRLIQIIGDARNLSLQSGDTPLHAALMIALEKDKGQRFTFHLFISIKEISLVLLTH